MPEFSIPQETSAVSKVATFRYIKRGLPLLHSEPEADIASPSRICGVSAQGEPQPTGRSGMRGPYLAAARTPTQNPAHNG